MEFMIFSIILALVLWAGGSALLFWIAYRLVVSAVRSGILEANIEQVRRDSGLPPSRWSIIAARVDTSEARPQ